MLGSRERKENIKGPDGKLNVHILTSPGYDFLLADFQFQALYCIPQCVHAARLPNNVILRVFIQAGGILYA